MPEKTVVNATEPGSKSSGSKNSGATRMSLIARARGQQSAAWEELVELYGPLVAHWCSRCGLDSHTTADCVQEVFTAVARSLGRFEAAKASGAFRSWLWTIAANKIKDAVRKAKMQTPGAGGSTALQRLTELPDESSIPAEEPSDADQLQAVVARGLEQVRAEFESRTWSIFQRTVIDQLPTDIVAKEFNITAATVRQIRSRVLRRLRMQLGDLAE
ncbi:MAG: sigma-70 family RNA polymerase sigma factor [Pirellulaceae bacterium]|nr:sigma-70 family RNA polymerase sigma factor [Pirellulaceae bacterium]